jgi:hypothetical protein
VRKNSGCVRSLPYFFAEFGSYLCCRNGADKNKSWLGPLLPALEKAMKRPEFCRASIRINEHFALSSLAISGGRQFVTKHRGPQSYKIKGTTSTRLIPPALASAESKNPLMWFLCLCARGGFGFVFFLFSAVN